jgi:hypothetical protein
VFLALFALVDIPTFVMHDDFACAIYKARRFRGESRTTDEVNGTIVMDRRGIGGWAG